MIIIPDFSTISSVLLYKILRGRNYDIRITEGSPGLPSYPPYPPDSTSQDRALTHVDYFNVVIKCIFKPDNTLGPHYIQLSLFKPKPSLPDPSLLVRPPVGMEDTDRHDNPRRENLDIWNNWIEPNWEPVPGPRVENNNFAEESDNLTWPGDRSCAYWMNPNYPDASVLPIEVPLRVARSIFYVEGEYLLLLIEIKRKSRLRLLWRPFFVKPKINCLIATAAYGSPISPQVNFLRSIRDEVLKKTHFGALFVEAYEWIYYKFSPQVAEIMTQKPAFKKLMRWVVVNPIVHVLMGVFSSLKKIRKKKFGSISY